MPRQNKNTNTKHDNIEEMVGRSMRDKALNQIPICKRRDKDKVHVKVGKNTYLIDAEIANDPIKLAAYFEQKAGFENNSRNNHNDSSTN